jgi:hypothetical protein
MVSGVVLGHRIRDRAIETAFVCVWTGPEFQHKLYLVTEPIWVCIICQVAAASHTAPHTPPLPFSRLPMAAFIKPKLCLQISWSVPEERGRAFRAVVTCTHRAPLFWKVSTRFPRDCNLSVLITARTLRGSRVQVPLGAGGGWCVCVCVCNIMYPKVSGLAACSENCKWYSSLPLGAVVSLFCESV